MCVGSGGETQAVVHTETVFPSLPRSVGQHLPRVPVGCCGGRARGVLGAGGGRHTRACVARSPSPLTLGTEPWRMELLKAFSSCLSLLCPNGKTMEEAGGGRMSLLQMENLRQIRSMLHTYT